MRLGLLVLLGLALCAAQTADNETDPYFPAPYFDEGENLSSQNCGNEASWNKWIVFVKQNSTRQLCYPFIAISQRTLLGLGNNCPWITNDTTNLRVIPSYCLGKTQEECIRNSVKVLNVIDTDIHPTADLKFKIWITEKMPSELVTPICLFNRDNVMDLQLQRESPYFELSISSDPPPYIPIYNVTGQSNCNRILSSAQLEDLKTKNIPIQNILCVKLTKMNSQYLIKFYKGRYFLRGVKYYRNYHFYIDLLPYIDDIARQTKDIPALRPVPQTKQPRGFKASDNLSFPNCGRKPTSTRRRRGIVDSSEDLQPTRHILGGIIAQTGNHPWHVYIENYMARTTCGGTLISPTAVLTAAHCIYGSEVEDFIVSLGLYDKRQRSVPGVQTRLVTRLIVHPKYDSAEFNSDIGLMILNKKIEITDHVQPICLWNDDSDSNLARVAGTEAMAVGFGLVDNHTRTDELLQARLPIRGHRECFLSSRRFFGKFLRPGDNFCAGYTNGTTTCNGDSGGSLSIEKNGRWFIRGIVSFGKSKKVMFEGEERSFCHPNQYTLFVDVANYVDWIVENTPEISF